MVALGDCRTFGTHSAALINEIDSQDMETWSSEEYLREHFKEVGLELEHASENLLYGDQLAHPPGFGIDEFPISIKNLFKTPGCLTNKTRCENKNRYNVEYGLTEDIMLGGLEKLFRSVMTKIYQVIIQAEEEFQPDPKVLKFFDEVFDYDYVDGLTMGIDELELLAQEYADESVFSDTIQLIVILVFVAISYFVVFVYMASELKLRNYQIAELFIYLPQDLVKTIPELANYLRTGEIDRGVIEQINTARDKYKLGNANKQIKTEGKEKDGKEAEGKEENKKTFAFFKSKEKPATGGLLKPDEIAKADAKGSNVKLNDGGK
jgi:hypothetical protein